ncbi:MAG: hypothetical protein V1915_02435 [Candidatus Bathyarchaeota archaeon]
MSRERGGSLIVTNGNDVGIITEKDILSKVLVQQANITNLKLKDIMKSTHHSGKRYRGRGYSESNG